MLCILSSTHNVLGDCGFFHFLLPVIDPKVARRFKDLNLFQQREEMGNGDLISALGEGDYSNITMLTETL